MRDKNFLITGASSGIGYCVAEKLFTEGAYVIGVGRNVGKMKTNQIIERDFSYASQVLPDLISDVPELDGVLLCAGAAETVAMSRFTAQRAAEVMALNLFNQVEFLTELIKQKKLKKQSSVVLVSSIAARVPIPGNGMYSASKAAMEAIARNLAVEHARREIRFNVVAPGQVWTPMTNNLPLSPEALEADQKKYPLGYGTPEQVAGPILFLLSPASSWMTGSVLTVDGGRSLCG